MLYVLFVVYCFFWKPPLTPPPCLSLAHANLVRAEGVGHGVGQHPPTARQPAEAS